MLVAGWLPGAGTRPGGRGTFLPRGKKVPKETRPAVCDPHATRGGTPGARRWRGALRNSLRAARFAQTAAASQTTKHARLRACHPATASPQAQPERGWRRHEPSLRSAWRARRAAPACWGPSAAMARVVSTPFQAAPGARRWWGGMREVAHASWSDSLRLFERSAVGAQRVPQCTPPASRPRGAPTRSVGVADCGARFFGYFLAAWQESTSPAGASPGSGKQTHHKHKNSQKPKTSKR